jgi:hypothetical protein
MNPDITFARRLSLAAITACLPAAAAYAQTPPEGDKPYTVVEGYKVDPRTMNGFRAWRAAACDRCHGASQQGLVGPSLLESMKTITRENFATVLAEGRLEKGMPSFSGSPAVMEHTEELYIYLKGRSNGDITRAKVEELK